MRYILMTAAGPEHVDAWRNGTAEDKEAEIEATRAWFRLHATAGRITGGEELAWPGTAKTVRKKGITDGPFAETKEMRAASSSSRSNPRPRPSKWPRAGLVSPGMATWSRSVRRARPRPRRPHSVMARAPRRPDRRTAFRESGDGPPK